MIQSKNGDGFDVFFLCDSNDFDINFQLDLIEQYVFTCIHIVEFEFEYFYDAF